jgi:hypothetical protein
VGGAIRTFGTLGFEDIGVDILGIELITEGRESTLGRWLEGFFGRRKDI